MLSIISVVYNKPSFLLKQYNLLKKFVVDKFVFCVYDNSVDSDIEKEFKKICIENGMDYFKVPPNFGSPSIRAGFSLNFALTHNYNLYKNNICVLDSDLFPISKINFSEIIKKTDFLGRGQLRPLPNDILQQEKIFNNSIKNKIFDEEILYYYTNQFLVINVQKNSMKDVLNCGFLPESTKRGISCDCGGHLDSYIRNNKKINFGGICVKYSKEIDNSLTDEKIKKYIKKELEMLPDGYSEIFNFYDNSFLHFRSGGNWQNHSEKIVKYREKNLFDYLAEVEQ